mgnify:CR=1 FL=1
MDIYREWKNGRLPIINGILYENGIIEWINIDYDSNYKRIINRGSNLCINDLILKNELHFSNISTCYQFENNTKDIVVYCGGGSHGSEGFIVVESKVGSKLIWIAFFEESNPYEKIEFIDEKINVYNNLKEKWSFDLNIPTNLTIT